MIAEVFAGLALSLVAVWFVLRPVVRPETALSAEPGAGSGLLEDEEDLSPRAQALRALKEIEFDRATGKLSDTDYTELKAKYTADALAAMREGDRGEGRGMLDASGRPGAEQRPSPRSPLTTCPVHGARPLGDAVFCDECGRRLVSAHGFCNTCGASLTAGAGFCNACGGRVAA